MFKKAHPRCADVLTIGIIATVEKDHLETNELSANSDMDIMDHHEVFRAHSILA
jgi:hypothetical protein